MTEAEQFTPIEELSCLWKVRLNPMHLQGPTLAERRALRDQLKQEYDWPSEEEQHKAMVLAYHVTKNWQAAQLQRNRGVKPVEIPVAELVSETWEARVKGMKYAELAALCEHNGLGYEKVAPNPGILTMRARNCVYAALRRGVELQPVPG